VDADKLLQDFFSEVLRVKPNARNLMPLIAQAKGILRSAAEANARR
jgi:hypothetical protein